MTNNNAVCSRVLLRVFFAALFAVFGIASCGSGGGSTSTNTTTTSTPTPAPAAYTITATTGGNGTISPSGVTTVNQGASQTYTITPNSGYTMSSLTVDGGLVATAYSYSFANVQANRTISATFALAPTSNSKSPLGTNLSDVQDWSTEWVFVDVFKMSRKWISQKTGQPWGGGDPLVVDTNGWVTSLLPGQSADALVMWRGTASGLKGEYVVLYDGEGTLGFSGSGASIVSSTIGRIVLNINPSSISDGLIVSLTTTNPTNYLRNIRIIRPGFESTYLTEPFHPLFLDSISKFKVIRFMDWQKTNNSTLANWADRTTMLSSTQTGGSGVALEYQIALANKLNADAWFNIPHLATNDFVLQFATIVKAQLNPGLKVYIEYSNEVWNSQFTQASYAEQQGLASGLSTNNFQAQLRYYSQRSVEVFNIFSSVFAGDTNRLVRVLATQAGNSWTATQVAGWQNAYQSADAVAIAPYFCNGAGVGDPAAILAMTADQLLDYCTNEITTTALSRMNDNYAVISGFGLPMIAYEGGQHLVGVNGTFKNQENQTMTDLFISANRAARMKTLYTTYFNQWKAAGGKMFVNYTSVYSPSKYGSWGLFEYQDQDPTTAPKYQALMEFIAANPTPW